MLKVLRQGGTGQVLMGAIVFAIIAVFILEFRQTARMQTGSLKRECAVSIAGGCVTPKDYYAEFGLVVPRGLSAKQVKAYGLRQKVLDGIIERELLVDEAHRLGLSIEEEAVKKELRQGRAHVSLPAAGSLRLGYMLDLVSADESGISRDMVRELPILNAKTNEVDDDLYTRVVRSMTNRSPKEFLKMQQREVLAARLRDLVRARVRVSEDEAFDAFARDKSKAVVRFVRLDAEWFGRWGVDSSDEAVDKWASEHKSEVDEAWKTEGAKWKADCLLASEIVATFREGVTEAQKSLLKDKMDRARARLDAGAAFEDAAKEFSDGPTGMTGGQIGCLTKEAYGEDADVLAKTAEGLSPDAASPVVETKSGYHIVRATGHLAASDVESHGRRAVARPLAVRAAALATMSDVGRRLIAAVKGGARLDDTMQALAPELVKANTKAADGKKGEAAGDEQPPALRDSRAPRAEVSAPFNQDGDPIPGTFGASALSRISFDLAKPDDVHPEPIAIPGGLVVLQLKEKTAATREDFAKEKGDVVKRLAIAKQSDALTRYVARLRQSKQDKIQVNERILEEPKSVDRD